MAKGIKRKIKMALNNVNKVIADHASSGFFAAGLSSKGYDGGYRNALEDVLLALSGIDNNNSRHWPQGNE